ncbi:FmdB family zinc ribbon protein [Enterobacter hormaechei]|uniref:FmdB family zinc ribbon protein n=1 Tax=Enterobacter hormaechei TaxID=158836 RepID=UPI003B21A457
MPTYSYKCPDCGAVFDKNQKIAERKTAPCNCGATALQSLSAPRTIKNGYYEQGRAFVR